MTKIKNINQLPHIYNTFLKFPRDEHSYLALFLELHITLHISHDMM